MSPARRPTAAEDARPTKGASQSACPDYGGPVPLFSRSFERANRVNLRAMRVVLLFAVLVLGLPAEAAKPPAKAKAPQPTTSQRTAQSMLKSLSLRERIAQLVIGVCY